MYMTKEEKCRLWEARIQEFHSSERTCKDWCREQQIPVATMNYWLRKQKNSEIPSTPETLFAKLPTEEEVIQRTVPGSAYPIRIFIKECIRIEIGSLCPAELLNSLARTLKEHA